MQGRNGRAASLLFALLVSSSSLAFGQEPPPAPPAGKAAEHPANAMAEARKRHDLGLKLYDDGNYEAARIEFERAFALAPSHRILYNIALAYRALNNYVDALNTFERYLAEGGSEIQPDRRARVEKDIAELRSRIARVRVITNVPGVEISIDGIVVGKAPLTKPLPVNPGVRKVSGQAPGYLPRTITITVGSTDEATADLELESLSKTARPEPKSNPWVAPAVVGWSATGVAAITAGVFAALSLNAKSDQRDKLEQMGVTHDELKSARDKTQTLSGVADALLITTAVFAGVSTFFTVKLMTTKHHAEGEKHARQPELRNLELRNLELHWGPGGIAASASF
ncbi:PEGA domain-containing protein [Pendulispora albinea]|uniref:PEGA domain-containing protein n=1 Tax=Pendulispora albinea TaxID=2741071 RepID=A0ABZ2M313_9BACT